MDKIILNGDARQLNMVANYSMLKPFELHNPANWHVSLIVSSVRINYELI